jgi:hypothetical protein
MCCLAQPACSFIMSLDVSVRGYLQQENDGNQCQRERQGPLYSAPRFSFCPLHLVPQQIQNFACFAPEIRISYGLGCRLMQQRFVYMEHENMPLSRAQTNSKKEPDEVLAVRFHDFQV